MSEKRLAPRDKREFYRRYFAGEFGNRTRTWTSLPELLDSGWSKPIGIRDTVPGGKFFMNVLVDDLRSGKWPEGLTTLNGKVFSETTPDSKLLVQGNLCLTQEGLYLEYSRERNVQLRTAVSQPLVRFARRSAAASILKQCLNPNSHDDVTSLLDTYPDAVIEFSAYETWVGVCPARNTVIWEVRNY